MKGAYLGRAWLAGLMFVSCLALWTVPTFAQSGAVRGRVVDEKNQPVEGATVTIELP